MPGPVTPPAVIGVVVAAVFLASSACSRRGEDLQVHTDLLRLFPFTDAGQEVTEIALGSAAAGAHLLEGWSQAERLPSGDAVAWAVERRAGVRFGIRRPTDGRVVLRCGLGDGGPVHPWQVTVNLNQRRLGTFRVRPGLEEYSLKLPARLQRRGANELELYNPFISRAGRNVARGRNRVVACASIRFEGLPGEAHDERQALAGIDPTGDALLIPAPAHVDFFLRLPAAASLAFDLTVDGSPDQTRLRVTLQRRGRPPVQLADSGSGPARRFDLGADAGEVARLTFAAVGRGTTRLVRPRLLGRPMAATQAAPVTVGERPPNIVLYLIDTLRADHLGCYGYTRATSPQIDALAGEGILFEDVIAQAPWTRPATASILTGRYPAGHGAVTVAQGIRPGVPTLAEALHAHGYRTAAFVTNVNVSGSYGFRRGFDHFTYLPEDPNRPGVHFRADRLNDPVRAWLQENGDRPFFLYVHASDPHAPYAPPPPFDERFHDPGLVSSLPDVPNPVRVIESQPALATPANVAYLTALYDGEIAFTDASFGDLLAALERDGGRDRTLVVVTADHGEEFKDHGGFEHGLTVYHELTHVPLILRLPGAASGGTRIQALVRQIDILPTLLDYAGAPAPAGVDGQSLRPLVTGGKPPSPSEAFTQTRLGQQDLSALVTPSWKVIVRGGHRSPRVEVYDLAADPAEERDLIAREPILAGYGTQALARWATVVPRPPRGARAASNEPRMNPELRERLRALGYAN